MGWLSDLGGFFTGSNQREAADAATNQLNKSKQEAIGYLNPWSKAGGSALSPLTGLLTGNSYDYNTGTSTALSPEQRLGLFQTSPGYQFRLDEALKALQNSQVAKGNSLSGGALKEITNFSQGIASDEYSNYLNQLFQLASIGQQADIGKANATINVANPLAEAAFSRGIASDIGANRLIQTALGGAGIGFGANGLGGSSSSNNVTNSTGGGQYNSAFMQKALMGGLV